MRAGPVSRATTSRRWPRLPAPPDASEGRQLRSASSARHAGRRPGLFSQKRWQPDWPTWKKRKAISRGLSLPGRSSPPGRVARPPEDRAGEHWPSRLALHRARRRPGRCCLPGPRAQFTAPLTFPARPRPVRPAAFSGLHPRGRVSGFSATQGPFPASQPLCVRATCPLPALLPSLP